ncbi:ArnT family glycosyltransferase [Natronosalvus caseinilyticus]|uniref:ArnT family glycosyltransferase n=1 Tax=Natronosalvus caseinilyticus TaxID=2953747 RepID=UPI0028B151B1|nr:glycosyltransferase family 39 protein [Natronosalvus caseinilyticus]
MVDPRRHRFRSHLPSRRSVRSVLRAATRPRERRYALLVILVSTLAGLVVFTLASELFPYHSSNDDEAVYLLQAAMLLEGQFQIHAGDLAEAVRPWFFVLEDGRLYPKYAPVPAGMFAVSMALFDEPRVTLAVVAALNASLIYILGSTVADRRVGLVSSVLFAASPMALLSSSVFLPYAPTTLWNLVFAVCYLRGVRSGDSRMAAIAGVAVGIAFFARPYTAVLFALPFIAHAGWQTAGALRRGRPRADPVRRNLLTGAIGLSFVALALAYNFRLTGSPLEFPFQAFAPLDGPGFGYREIGSHGIEYTPTLALEANGYVLWYFATRWVVAGPIGTLAAVTGGALAARRILTDSGSQTKRVELSPLPAALLASVVVTVVLGNVAFWGNFNILATMDDPTNGLVSRFGPFYHFDLLAPFAIFAAVAMVSGWRLARVRVPELLERIDAPGSPRRVLVSLALVATLVLAATTVVLVSGPIDRNADYTRSAEAAYEPFEDRELDDALVFQPAPYGQWTNHPFQALRNDPDLEGDVVYVLEGGPEREFAVLDAYPDRDPYRYTYRGAWGANPDEIEAVLQPLEVRRGATMDGETTVGVPDRVSRAVVTLEGANGSVEYQLEDPTDEISVAWTVAAASDDAGNATLSVPPEATRGPTGDGVELAASDRVVLSVTLVQPDGGTYTYRQETTVRVADGALEVVWPPETRGCRLATDCGREGTLLEDADLPEWERLGAELEVTAD